MGGTSGKGTCGSSKTAVPGGDAAAYSSLSLAVVGGRRVYVQFVEGGLIGVDADNLAATVAAYNSACTGDPARFDATRCDGLAASRTLTPPKSNWARAISEPPFLAWPLVGAVAYTFGGLATDDRARVLREGAPIPGLYAAGELVGGLFYENYPGGTGLMSGSVFGKRAGAFAAEYARGINAPAAASRS